MSEIEFRSNPTVELIDWMPKDVTVGERVVQAARVSSGTEASGASPTADAGLLRMLMRDRHGSPWEKVVFTWRIECPIFVSREFFRHRVACLAGDTRIWFGSQSGGARWKTIAEHWEHWHQGVPDSMGRTRKLPSIYSAKVRSHSEETLTPELSTVLDVVKAGVKPVWKLTTVRGFTVTASADHRFYGPKGWFRLSELSVGDEVYVQGRSGIGPSRGISRTIRNGIQAWVSSVRPEVFERDGQRCQGCGAWGEIDSLRCDHRVPVAANIKLALDIDNLQTLCLTCDRRKTDREQALADRTMNFAAVTPDAIESLAFVGEEETYDLVLDAPHHNFMANGIMVHNSYNETSSRYRVMEPVFYVPPPERPLRQKGKPGAYHFESGDQAQYETVVELHRSTAEVAWHDYQEMLAAGVAREVARNVLPLSLFTSFYVTMNLRSFFNFASLRRATEVSADPTFPLHEIAQVCGLMEDSVGGLAPEVWELFNRYGRRPV